MTWYQSPPDVVWQTTSHTHRGDEQRPHHAGGSGCISAMFGWRQCAGSLAPGGYPRGHKVQSNTASTRCAMRRRSGYSADTHAGRRRTALHRGPSTCIEDSSLAYGSHEWSSDGVPRFLWSPARLSAGSVHCARMCSTLAECPHSDASTPRQGLTVCGGTRWGTYASAYVPAHGSSCRSRFPRGAAGRCSWVDTRHHRWDSADERRNWHARDAEALSMMITGVREINLADLRSVPAWRL